jgi:hypothetical protein
LNRAALDFIETQPQFAIEVGLSSLAWILAGRIYEVTAGEVMAALDAIKRAALVAGSAEQTLLRVRMLLDAYPQERFVHGVLERLV